MTQQISDEQWVQFEEEGYLRLGKVMDDDELEGLQQRIDDIMLGKVKVHDQMYMQLDSETGDYSEKRITMRGHEVATLNYRKLQDLEFDPLFLSYMQKSLFREICTSSFQTPTRSPGLTRNGNFRLRSTEFTCTGQAGRKASPTACWNVSICPRARR